MKKTLFFKKITALLVGFTLVIGAALFTTAPKTTQAKAESVVVPGGIDTTELAAYWKFDETSGSVAADSSGYGRDLKLFADSVAQWSDNGAYDGMRSFKFDGESAFLMFNTEENNYTDTGAPYWIVSNYHADGVTKKTEDDQSLTLSFFIQIDDIVYDKSAPEVNGFNLLFGNESLGVGNAGSLEGALLSAEHFKDTGAVDVAEFDPEFDDNWLFGGIKGTGGIVGGADKVVSPQNINDMYNGEWKMVTFVIDDNFDKGTCSFTLYIDGVLASTQRLSLTEGLTKSLGKADNAFCIGGWKGEDPEATKARRGFHGSLSEFMVFTRALSASEVAALMAGYSGEDTDPDGEEPVVTDPIVVTLNQTSVSSLQVGQTYTLMATVTPASTEDKSVTWSSSNTAIATVDSSGKVTAVAKGAVTITATSVADPTKSASCAFNIKEAEATDEEEKKGCGTMSFVIGGGSGGMLAFIGAALLLGMVIVCYRKNHSLDAQ